MSTAAAKPKKSAKLVAENSPEIKQTSRRKSKRGDASRIKPWQWKPGQSGNPGGRPKGIVSAALLEQLLRKAAKGEKSELQAIVEAIVATAKKGNAKAFCAIRDTVDGPPKPDPQDRGPQVVVQFVRDPPTPPIKVVSKPEF